MQQVTELLYCSERQSLGQDIGNVIARWDVLEMDLSAAYEATHMMHFDIDVLVAGRNLVLGSQPHGCCAIHMDNCHRDCSEACPRALICNFPNKLPYPGYLLRTG